MIAPRQVVQDVSMPLDAVLLAAEVKVAATLAGETLPPGSWRDLVAAATRAQFPELDPNELGFDRDTVARYRARAVELIAEDPDADHNGQTLLSADELRFQLDELAGPTRELPAKRAHEVFEERLRIHPDAVAAVHGSRVLTYRELNARANRLARALLARGLELESVVAVVTERNLDWMTAVLAIFKAGGAYLPIEPNFPPDRIAKTISRADCRLVLTERGSTGSLHAAAKSLPGLEQLLIEDAFREQHADDDLGVAVSADQLAYIYFTSGSTGEPKGAMCEHAGMLNHLFAKIDDLGIGSGTVVAQTAPQCFDISLWQLISALLVGGRTLIIEQEAILDVARFVDKLVDGKVDVLQVVPSYLEVVLSYLDDHPRELPDLRCVSVTGEALKMELVQRWFAARPAIKLVNAYGLTETSDDTNHEVMEDAPAGERVPLGRPVNNVRVYVVDEQLAPVPFGAPGEIVFSGVCVGRGYVNDPERTERAFVADPHRSGHRLYRSGDFGRWRPDGKLEFLGRRDSQVKINGFRIEIGEIENKLLQVPAVRDGAVVVSGGGDHAKRLVAFYMSRDAIDVDALRDRLSESLPHYMIPSAFHRREQLPVTGNGKIDKKALTALATELAEAQPAEAGGDAPASATERRLAAAWAEVLGVSEGLVSRRDHFFDRGGSSLSAVKLAIALDRVVSIKDVTAHPVLADLAALIDGRSERRSGLVQPLTDGERAALVCFPYAGGNAVNFQAMARALRGSGVAVYAVELPGHDLTAEPEAFAPLEQVAEAVAAEISERGLGQVMVWGHSSGCAFAAETARRLEDRGVVVERVFAAAQLPGSAADRRRAIAELEQRSARELAPVLAAEGGYTELADLDEERAAYVGAAYKHDFGAACRWFATQLESPDPAKLAAPVTVVVAPEDPATSDAGSRCLEWLLVSDEVHLAELPRGGHYFLRTHAADAAAVVTNAVELTT